MPSSRHHSEWLSLIEVSGPFLSVPVLDRVFPQGLDPHDPDHVRVLRLAFDEWEDDRDGGKSRAAIHREWIRFVLKETLGLPEEVLAEDQAIPATIRATISEHGETLRPDVVVRNPDGVPNAGKPRLLVQVYPPAQNLEKPISGRHWKASPATRMMELLHATDVRLGLITNGEHWMLVDGPKGETTGFASWYATLWSEEPLTLRAFQSLLGTRRFFSVPDDETLEAMLAESATHQQEVTDRLGYQVREAVEEIIRALDRIDQNEGRQLLAGVPEPELYRAALTVMMRLVFLFSAEERGLLLLGDPLYDEHYAVSTLVAKLQEAADQHGEEVLERRHDAWVRLLSTFRAVYGGVQHERMKLLPYAGSLFNPDEFPFLEGRFGRDEGRGTSGEGIGASREGRGKRDEGRAGGGSTLAPNPSSLAPAKPLPIDNRTVLHLLRSLQYLELHGEARRLSFRALDIEQIGHVYEGLLDHTAKRATEPIVSLVAGKGGEPEVAISELERLKAKGDAELLKFLKEQTGRGENALTKALATPRAGIEAKKLLAACGNDEALFSRLRPFSGLVRNDTFDRPVVIRKGSVFVTAGTDRRSSGTHYTPRSLTEPIVQYTLEPLIYVGPAEGKAKEEWVLRSAKDLLELKICDMACGSGAFLVQACRYMSERLVEAWENAERGERLGARGEGRQEGGELERSALPGLDRLAEGNDSGAGLLRGDEAVSEVGAVRNDEPDSESGGVDPSEHRRGSQPGTHQGVLESSQYRAGVPGRAGNAPDSQPPGRTAGAGTPGPLPGPMRRDQPNASRPEEITGNPPVNPPLSSSPSPASSSSSRPSPLTPRPSEPVPPRITPEGTASTGAANEQLIPKDTDERLAFARRIVAQRCLYGVDKNPLAVEMAKLSLWLLTLAKDKPFSFLDHAIRCGDSLVGISSETQLKTFSLDGQGIGITLPNFLDMIPKILDATKLLRIRLEKIADDTVANIEDKQRLFDNIQYQTKRLNYAADRLMAASWQPMKPTERLGLLRKALQEVDDRIRDIAPEILEAEGRAHREQVGCPQPLHWPLEFPEVMDERGGFDAFVGNPPFIGGRRIRSTFGGDYLNWLLSVLCPNSSGNADLCAFFFRRAHSLVKDNGSFGLLATNTIGQGDTKATGLEVIARDASIPRAISSRQWPGSANVHVSEVWVWKGTWHGLNDLDGKTVPGIAPSLTPPIAVLGKPHPLKSNAGLSYMGSVVLGVGFTLQPDEAKTLIELDGRNSMVLMPFLNGQDLNSDPHQKPQRWIINFFDWPLDRQSAPQGYSGPVAADFHDWLNRVRNEVKPLRDGSNRKVYRERWWQYAERQARLYDGIKTLDRVLVVAATSRTLAFAFVPTEMVFSHALYVFALSQPRHLALLQSAYHESWCRELSSSMKGDLRYTNTEVFENFPFPKPMEGLDGAGLLYDSCRKEIMLSRREGLTKIYNRFHNPDESAVDIKRLRDLHVELDAAVSAAYGWADLDLGHGFHETKQGTRFTISESARREVLARLLKLNHERYAEEVEQGLHEKKGRGTGGEGREKKGKKRADSKAPSLGTLPFGDDDDDPDPAANRVKASSSGLAHALSDGDVWYFAYGSNMSVDRKTERTSPIRRAVPCRLVGFRLEFNKRPSHPRGGVYANIMPDPDGTVWGVAYLCNPDTIRQLDGYEGLAGGHYKHETVAVISTVGETFQALTYVAGDDFVVKIGRPSDEYLAHILKGAHDHQLPEDYIRTIEAEARGGGPRAGRLDASRESKAQSDSDAYPSQENRTALADPTSPLVPRPKPLPTHPSPLAPTPIDQVETDEVMAAFRQAARNQGWIERDELIKQVSLLLGYRRLGPKIDEALRGHLRAAIRRRIIETDGPTLVHPGTTTMADYELEDLRESFRSVMRKGTRYEREDVIHALARYLGFVRVTDTIREPIKSAINSAIRRGLLGYEGSIIWREE